MSCRKKRQQSGDVFFVKVKGMARKFRQRVENGTPRDLVLFGGVVKMSSPGKVLGQDERVISPVANGKGPIADQFCEAIGPPPLVSGCNNHHVLPRRQILP